MQVKLILKEGTTDITAYILKDGLQITERSDAVFSSGSFEFISKTIKENLPPYTIIETKDGENIEYYVGTSEVSKDLANNLYHHKVSLLEGTALLSRFILGTKALSNYGTDYSDNYKFNVVNTLISLKYKVGIKLLNNRHNLRTEYSFGAGTTLYDAVLEMSKIYNERPKLTKAYYNNGKLNIEYDLVSLNSTEYELDNNRLLAQVQSQNAETYCRVLESESTNVIDRNNLTIANNLFLKSNEIKLGEDTARLELPTKAERVIDFGMFNMSAMIKAEIGLNTNLTESMNNTFEYWANKFPTLHYFYDLIFKDYFKDKEAFYQTHWMGLKDRDFIYSADPSASGTGEYIPNGIMEFASLGNHLLSKEQWELLDEKNKPNYAYYTNGSNLIEGLNTYYKNDFWNNIIGETVTSFFDKLYNVKYNDGEGYVFGEFKLRVFQVEYDRFKKAGTRFDNVYYAKYYPIGNPMLKDVKEVETANEYEFKNYALSYNKGSNYIDFDKIVKAMKIENESIGRQEFVITIDATNIAKPKSRQSITFNNEQWYIVSVNTTYLPTQTICIINLVKNYNKLADVIGLSTQYNTTKLPYNSIVERPIFIEVNESITIEPNNCYLMMRIRKNDDITGADETKLIKPVTIYSHDGVTYLYVEALDHYSFDKYAEKVGLLYKMKDASYVDEYNMLESANFSLVKLPQLSVDSAMKLPIYDGTYDYEEITLQYKETLYKDAREKLTFTIKCNNCIIK